MRTTLVLDDDLVQEARHRAVDKQITLSEYVNRALREALASTGPLEEQPFAMVTYGPDGPVKHHEPADFAAQMEEDDRMSVGR
jgi:Arc/MetJ family transcription regulator